LNAFLASSVLPEQLLVVDQGGLRETAAVVSTRCNSGLPLQHIRSQKQGLSAARNTGLGHVATSWVAFIDDDCVPTPTWLETIYQRLTAPDQPDGVTGRVLPLGEAAVGTHTLSLRVSNVAEVFKGSTLPWRVGTGGNMALEVDMLRRAGGYDERLGAGSPGAAGEDLEVVHRLLRQGAALAFEPAVVVYHDRVSAQRRLATRRSYGFGMGAFAGLWMRRDPWVAVALSRWMLARASIALRASRDRDAWRLREERLLVAGAIAGLRYGWGLASPVAGSTGERRTYSSGE
jgi:glycosyltransferase involved in cell wall biosynthesis